MQGLGLSRDVRRSVLAEMRKVVGGKPELVKATAGEMARYGKDPSLASMLINPFVLSSGTPSLPLAKTDNIQTLSATTSYTITAAIIGAAAAARVIYITVSWYEPTFSGSSISAMTVGGDTATRAVRAFNGSNFNNAEIWSCPAGTGSGIAANTTANIVMTLVRDVRMTTAVYRGDGYSSTAGTTGTGTTSASVTIGAAGMALVVCCNIQNAAGSISNVTEDYNFSVSAGGQRGIHGSKESAGGQSLTSTFSSASPNATLMAAAPF
ncbi:hypothetical protein FJ930_18425 [Mesorhizobium sp. B2-4-15]|uniref:hypothetical protein n=1 Tax=unclassified Mesorhizobium TaxID=325217 RepID=UPI00112EDC6E|nr:MULTISPECIES: hypothetical protein [unclassified Mesorhizobium]TPK70300.1 hypothetical protein FJ930_18425 [Mesorhizobium sp. B2-4-15]TPM35853.1 hypothetical protein FJ958_03425 [Mesorhizobium sp. B2-3-5]